MHSLPQIKLANALTVWKIVKEHGYFYAQHQFLNKTSERFVTESEALNWVEQH